MFKHFQKEVRGVVCHGSEIESYDEIVFSLASDNVDNENTIQLSLASPIDDIEITIFLTEDIKKAIKKFIIHNDNNES